MAGTKAGAAFVPELEPHKNEPAPIIVGFKHCHFKRFDSIVRSQYLKKILMSYPKRKKLGTKRKKYCLGLFIIQYIYKRFTNSLF
jgi:hypothetical protein